MTNVKDSPDPLAKQPQAEPARTCGRSASDDRVRRWRRADSPQLRGQVRVVEHLVSVRRRG